MNTRTHLLDGGWTGYHERIGREAFYDAARYGRAG